MHDFHAPTFVLIAGLVSALMGWVLLALRRNYPPDIEGLREWGLACLACACATLIYKLETLLGRSITSISGAALMLLGFVLFYSGSARFWQQREHLRWMAAWSVVAWVAMVIFSVVWPDYRGRASALALGLAGITAAHFWVVWRHAKGLGGALVKAVTGVQCAVLVLRGISTWWVDAPDTTRFAPGLIQTIYLATFAISALMMSVSAQLVSSERVRRMLENLATHDSLTGVLVRRAWLQAAGREWARWQRNGSPMAVLMLDIDHFKRVNDQHGHAVGDAVLKHFAQEVRDLLRPFDRLARYGGEEFIVLAPDTQNEGALGMGQRICQTVADRAAQAGLPAVTVSVGAAVADAGDTSLDALVARADAALYRAKQAGRNRVVVD